MNPRLVKFVVELQNNEKIEQNKENEIKLSKAYRNIFFSLKNAAKVTVPVDKN